MAAFLFLKKNEMAIGLKEDFLIKKRTKKEVRECDASLVQL